MPARAGLRLLAANLYKITDISIPQSVSDTVELEFGMDASGDQESDSITHVAMVLGTSYCIGEQIGMLPKNSYHMRKIQNKKRRRDIFKGLNFGGKDLIAFCLRVDRDMVISKVSAKRKNRSYGSIGKIQAQFDRCVYGHVRAEICSFAARHGHTWSDIAVQCDRDCHGIVKSNHLRPAGRGGAYDLADKVAWFNHAGQEPRGVRRRDLRDLILKELLG